jgi:hypothetical protein
VDLIINLRPKKHSKTLVPRTKYTLNNAHSSETRSEEGHKLLPVSSWTFAKYSTFLSVGSLKEFELVL